MKSCSVIIVSYQSGPVLFAALKTVLKQKQLAEVIVVDNGTPPAALARLQQIALTEEKLMIITGHGNIGFAKGCNLGAAKATGDYILILHPDCMLPPDALATMISEFQQKPDAMLAGCLLQNPDGTEQRGGRRELLTPATALVEALGLYRLFRFKRLNLHHTPVPAEPFEVPAISSAFMFMKRNDYTYMRGLDEAYFLHVEDLDFCLRVHKTGGTVICVPSVRVTHLMSHKNKLAAQFSEWQKAKGFRRYFGKNFQGKYLPGFLSLVQLCIMLRFALKSVFGTLKMRLRGGNASETAQMKKLMLLITGLGELAENNTLQNKTVLVTGATSQVGICVIRRLIASGASVLALSRTEPLPFQHEQLRWIKGDLNDRSLSLNGYLADCVVHCAPLWHLPGALHALASAEPKRIIAFGSTSVFAKALSKNDYEKEVARKLSLAENDVFKRCEEMGISATIMRPTLIYGVGLDKNITSLAHCIRRFGFFPVYPPAFGRRQPVHADDLAIAALQAMHNEKTYGKAYNLSGGQILTYRDMLERIFRVLGKKPRIANSTALPFMLDVTGKLLRRKYLNGEIARRMNDDLIFFHDDAVKDFRFSPRGFLNGGIRDIEGY